MMQRWDLFRDFLDRSPLPLAALGGTAPYVLHDANPAFCALVDCEHSEIVDRPLLEIVSACAGEWLCALVGRVATAEQGELLGEMLFSQSGDGQRYCACSAWPVRDHDQGCVRVMLQVTDTTASVQASHESELGRLRLQEVNQALMVATVREARLAELAEERARREETILGELRRSEAERIRKEDERVALESEVAVLAERNRMARELHDTFAQAFTGIRLQLDVAADLLPAAPDDARARIERAMEIALESLGDARHAVQALRAPTLKPGDLSGRILGLVDQMAVDHKVQVRFACVGEVRALRADVENNLFRIAQEALNNAYRHSGALNLGVQLTYTHSTVQLKVTDDGRGFDAESAADGVHTANSYGLQGIRERAQRMQAELRIDSRPGRGTVVSVAIAHS